MPKIEFSRTGLKKIHLKKETCCVTHREQCIVFLLMHASLLKSQSTYHVASNNCHCRQALKGHFKVFLLKDFSNDFVNISPLWYVNNDNLTLNTAKIITFSFKFCCIYVLPNRQHLL
jgi:hypothetical protein